VGIEFRKVPSTRHPSTRLRQPCKEILVVLAKVAEPSEFTDESRLTSRSRYRRVQNFNLNLLEDKIGEHQPKTSFIVLLANCLSTQLDHRFLRCTRFSSMYKQHGKSHRDEIDQIERQWPATVVHSPRAIPPLSKLSASNYTRAKALFSQNLPSSDPPSDLPQKFRTFPSSRTAGCRLSFEYSSARMGDVA
jgi:hypothetical protein